MAKGYVIARVLVTDDGKYAEYAKLSTLALQKYGGRPLVRSGRHEILEGEINRPRNIVIEFESYDAAKAWYVSPEYQNARKARQGAFEGEWVLVEGVS